MGTDPYGQQPQQGGPQQGQQSPQPYSGQQGQQQDPYGHFPGQPQYGNTLQPQYGNGQVQYAGSAPHPSSYSPEHPDRPKVGFVGAVKAFFQNYATFHGRASLGEYGWVLLFQFLVGVVLGILLVVGASMIPTDANGYSTGAQNSPLAMIAIALILLYTLATIIPGLALMIRRLHDTGKSGWFYLLGLIPGFGPLIVFILLLLGKDPSGVRFDNPNGSQPKPVPAEATN